MDAAEYAEMVSYWEISLRNARLSPETIRSYMMGARQYAAWCERLGTDPDLTLRSAEAWTASMLDAGLSASTAVARQLAVRRFSAWLAEPEREHIPRDLLLSLKAPKIDQKVVDALSTAELQALLAGCAGKRFVDRRDTALVRFMVATGARADETVQLKVIDVQIAAGSAVILRGKGGKGRRVGFGTKTAETLARYAMLRRKHPLAARPEFWLATGRGQVLNYDTLYHVLRRRAERAGIEGFHPHQLRHTFAVNWKRAGGSTDGLLSAGGWTSLDLVQRYVGHAQQDLAIAEARKLGLDDF